MAVLQAKCYSVIFFFFQAEDGIRDTSVTGVQTCALPISTGWQTSRHSDRGNPAVGGLTKAWPRRRRRRKPRLQRQPLRNAVIGVDDHLAQRSEERRVGKECRARWWLGADIHKVNQLYRRT